MIRKQRQSRKANTVYQSKNSMWLKVMRMRISLKDFPVLLLTVSISKVGKNKNIGKTGIHGSSPNWEQLLVLDLLCY